MRCISASLLLLLATPLILVAQGRTETAEAPTIRVVGAGTAAANPDLLQLHVAVVTSDTSAQRAATENAARVTSVLTALRAILGTGSAIITVSYSVNPVYYSGTQERFPRPVAFEARNVLRVETADLNKAGAIVDAAVAAGANNVEGILYTLRDQSKLRSEALAAAARDARAKADALAAGLGVRLAGIRTADESSRIGPMPYDAMPQSSTGTPLQRGPVEVTATVTVTYDIAR